MSISKIAVLSENECPGSLHGLHKGATYAMGALELINRPCVGLCGSRNASESALEWAYEFGCEAARQGVVVVSGYARGIDRAAHRGVMEAGGGTIAVLSEGIQNFRLVQELKSFIDMESNFLAVSIFEPNAPWKAWQAMKRNKIIVGLSSGLFVIEAGDRGGTIDAAFECIRQRKRLWAVAYKEEAAGREGSRRLLLSGRAIPLKHRDDLAPALEEAMSQPPPEMRQLVMNVTTPNKGAE